MNWKHPKPRLIFVSQALSLGLLLQFSLSACDPSETKMMYMPDMVDGPQVKAQRSYIDPPVGSVPRNAVLYPKTPEESESMLHSPYGVGADLKDPKSHIMAEGKHLYETFCVVCHGEAAKGNSRISDKYPPPPDLTADAYVKRGDGFFFHRITFGSAIMPSYGHAISAPERWKIVHYLRILQGKAPQQNAAPIKEEQN